ncbi:MAG: hypothetical protein EHM20_03820 [Alphaproteobacteria bacterium]|nr:MAG: hypothetical protein EHM20_03820 [Alphaproteobacteria bacterium]
MKLIDVIPYLEGLSSRITAKVEELKLLRKDLELPNVNYESYIQTIQRQKETANKNFTIAFVGMFNSGKSTVINGLLELKDDKGLSDNDSPDTAKSIRLSFKSQEQKCEAIIHFWDGTSEEHTWTEAKNFTSQVYLDEHSEFKTKAEKIIEVEYFVNHPILQVVDFLDLPGTGTKNWRTHTHLTHERLKEAEVVFWVIGTCAPEPSGSDLDDLKILREVKSNVIPLINVWSDKEEGVSGIVGADELERSIRSNLGAFFSSGVNILKYYAREIYKAHQNGITLRQEWGFQTFKDFLFNGYLYDATKKSSEKIRRISGSINSGLGGLMNCVSSDENELEILGMSISELDQKIQEESSERVEIGIELKGKLREIAGEKAQEIVDQCISASNAFLEEQIQLTNIQPMIDKFRGRDVNQELSEKFKNDYLDLNKNPNWLTSLLNDYFEDAKIVVEGRWKRFIKDFNQGASNKNDGLDIPSNFTDKILSNVVGGLAVKGLNLFLAGIFVYLLFVPGTQLAEMAIVAGLMTFNLFYDVLEKRRNTAKLRAKVMISNQKYELKNQLTQMGMELHNECNKRFAEILKQEGRKLSEKIEKLSRFKELVAELKYDLTNARKDIEQFEEGRI